MRAFDIFRRILWVKSVTGDEDVTTYSDEDSITKARVPRRPGDRFDLHSTEEDSDSLADPQPGDIVVLTQHHQLTHLVEATGARVMQRPRSTIRRGTRDERFPLQREFELLILKKLDEAPLIEKAFGFDPDAKGGELFAIAELPRFIESRSPLWLVQRRIAHAMCDDEYPMRLWEQRQRRKLRGR